MMPSGQAIANAEAAVSEDGRERKIGKELHDGIEPAVGDDCALVRVHVLPVDGFELRHAAGFAIEELQDGDADDVLLQVGVDAGDGDADLAVVLTDDAAEQPRDARPPAASRPA